MAVSVSCHATSLHCTRIVKLSRLTQSLRDNTFSRGRSFFCPTATATAASIHSRSLHFLSYCRTKYDSQPTSPAQHGSYTLGVKATAAAHTLECPWTLVYTPTSSACHTYIYITNHHAARTPLGRAATSPSPSNAATCTKPPRPRFEGHTSLRHCSSSTLSSHFTRLGCTRLRTAGHWSAHPKIQQGSYSGEASKESSHTIAVSLQVPLRLPRGPWSLHQRDRLEEAHDDNPSDLP